MGAARDGSSTPSSASTALSTTPFASTPHRRRLSVCQCYFGADRCSQCEALRSATAARKQGERTSSDLITITSLPDDALEKIALACGKHLPSFASVNQSVRQVVRPAMWRQAYEEANGGPVTCGEALPPALWLACLLKDNLT